MASLPSRTPEPAASSFVKLRYPRVFERLIVVAGTLTLGIHPINVVAAELGLKMFEQLSVTQQSPFVWRSPQKPIPFYELQRKSRAESPFPAFRSIAQDVHLPPPADQADPWTPADLAPIPLPDNMPVQGNPAGLVMLENAVGMGIIFGEVSDATTLNPIAGALVEIVGTGRTTETDGKGTYRFEGLPAGTFNIEASQLGYFGDSSVITVIEGSPSEIRFGLKVKPTDDSANEFTLEEETIVGEYQGDSQGDFNLSLAIDTPTLTSSLSRDDFEKTAVSDARGGHRKNRGCEHCGRQVCSRARLGRPLCLHDFQRWPGRIRGSFEESGSARPVPHQRDRVDHS